MDGRSGRRRAARAGLAAGLVALLLGGCGAGASDEGNSGAADGAAVPAEAPARGDARAGAAPEVGGPAADQAKGGGAPDLRVDQRAIIYTGTMQVRVEDVDFAAGQAVSIATAAGGFVGGDQRQSRDTDTRAELQLRVPAEKFTRVVDQLAALGKQDSREVRTEDVTEETVDLDARIASQRARVESARKLLARATTISDLVTLEGELARREADLASLEAKKRRLADLTALSTVTVAFVRADAPPAAKSEAGFLSGLRDGWHALLASLGVLLTVLGALLPWLVVLGVPLGLLFAGLRRRRRRAGPPAGPQPPVSAPQPVPAARSAP
ncbi:DUF4349 domain-containing protein [Micromonospora sp. PLK6-60]|uniref:DUF4349 domain-containing protein n=1 Tax=Micromonospora sp. PLK6-60 TaxID=2873383 RepID=UPI001CA63E43|nr:DUF4349 domain-containing protein [Micromonospora sp. PLK6-60]MBY8871491.1 DUF4349 domain-containing protein [Micromonospora sp. PLK6-60]